MREIKPSLVHGSRGPGPMWRETPSRPLTLETSKPTRWKQGGGRVGPSPRLPGKLTPRAQERPASRVSAATDRDTFFSLFSPGNIYWETTKDYPFGLF